MNRKEYKEARRKARTGEGTAYGMAVFSDSIDQSTIGRRKTTMKVLEFSLKDGREFKFGYADKLTQYAINNRLRGIGYKTPSVLVEAFRDYGLDSEECVYSTHFQNVHDALKWAQKDMGGSIHEANDQHVYVDCGEEWIKITK